MTYQPADNVGLAVSASDPIWRDLARNIDEALAAGLSVVELPLHDLDIVANGRILSRRLVDVRSIVDSRPATYTLHGHLGIKLMDEVHRLALHRDMLRVNIDIAADLGARHLVIHPGFVRRGASAGIEAAYARQREVLHAAGEIAEAAGVVICVENTFEFTGERITALPSRLAQELTAIDHAHVRATFDFSHGYQQCGMMGADFMAETRALAPFSQHLHMHDSFGKPADFWV